MGRKHELIVYALQDTVKIILKREEYSKSKAAKVASFLRSSWIEIPDRKSTSRFMRPRYVVQKADNTAEQHAEDGEGSDDSSEQGSSSTGTHWRPSMDEDSQDDPRQSGSPREVPSGPGRDNEEEQSNSSHVSEAVQTVTTNHGEAQNDKSFSVSAIYVSVHSPSSHTLSHSHTS